MQVNEADEETLVRQLLAGDEAVFEKLVERYHGSMVRLASTFVSSGAVAEEVTQETWLAVITGLHSFERRSSLKTWIFRILTNRAKTRAVREARSVPFSAFEDEEQGGEPAVDPARFRANGMWADPPHRWDDNSPEKLSSSRETMERIAAAIDDLPPNQRAVVVLRDVEGLEAEEVCNVLEISETNQRVLLHRARSRLRSALEAHLSGG